MGKTVNPSFLYFPRFSDVSLSPKTDIICLWSHQGALNDPRKALIIFEHLEFRNLKILGIQSFENVGKTSAGHPDDLSNDNLKSLDMGSISLKKTRN